jgi:uncharacterized protein (DUF433 family)
MTVALATQIEIDDRGVARIAGTRTKVAMLVLHKLAYGSGPKELHRQFPRLSMAQIHAALAYYYENQVAMDEWIAKDEREAEELSKELSDPAFRARLQESQKNNFQ